MWPHSRKYTRIEDYASVRVTFTDKTALSDRLKWYANEGLSFHKVMKLRSYEFALEQVPEKLQNVALRTDAGRTQERYM